MNRAAHILRYLPVLIAGILFGLGLTVAQMINPAKVLGFLDIAGNWDPTLLLVMTGALIIVTPAYQFILKRPAPLLAEKFNLPVNTAIDKKLMVGAILFGTGWGMSGFCPGPALTALITGMGSVIIFVAAMFAGFLLHKTIFE